MKPFSHAFEIAYSPSLEVLDHSEVFLDFLPGAPAFTQIPPMLHGKLSPDQIREIEESIELFPRIQALVRQSKADETFRIGNVDFTVTWHRPAERAGVFSILVDCKIASVSLLICRGDDLEVDEGPGARIVSLVTFMEALLQFAPENDVNDHRKFPLVAMTRRPLLASMFWPPYSPTNDSFARTIQLQVAYAFFQLNGELP